VVIVSLLLSLLAAETVVRMTSLGNIHVAETGNQYKFYEFDGRLGWKNGAGRYGQYTRDEFSYAISINSHGMRYREVPPQKPERLICEKEAWFEVNRKSSAAARLRLVLDSPFEFKSWRWYGKYDQRVGISVNGTMVGEKALHDGRNSLDIQVAEGVFKPGANLVSLKFRYHRWFSSHPLWLISAFLEKVDLD
jgi:hypothetical protein